MNTKKVLKRVGGSAIYTVGILSKLSAYGLTAAGSVMNGVENLANDFAKAPKLGIGEFLQKISEKGLHKSGNFLLKSGKDLWR